MQLSVKKSDLPFAQLHFKTGPIYIGRHIHSQVVLPSAEVSRRHTVIYVAENKWVVEDLDSANKTFLNDGAMHKSELNDGDVIRIADFAIEVSFQEAAPPQASVEMDDTRVTVRHDAPTVVRQCAAKEGPHIDLPAKRIRDFSRATRLLCRAASLKQLHAELLDVLHGQFAARDAWAALRKTAAGPMDCQGGRRLTSEVIKRSDLIMQPNIAEAIEKHKCVLVPQIPRKIAQGVIRSAIIAPIMRDKDCCGALYADNSRDHEHHHGRPRLPPANRNPHRRNNGKTFIRSRVAAKRITGSVYRVILLHLHNFQKPQFCDLVKQLFAHIAFYNISLTPLLERGHNML